MPNNQNDTNEIETIEILQERYQKLSEQKIVAETQREHSRQELESLKNQARDQFGSDDLETLKKQLTSMKKSNLQKRQDYQQQLDLIEKNLADINQQYENIDNEP